MWNLFTITRARDNGPNISTYYIQLFNFEIKAILKYFQGNLIVLAVVWGYRSWTCLCHFNDYDDADSDDDVDDYYDYHDDVDEQILDT